MNDESQVRICVVGEPAVGKTTLIMRYTQDKFYEERVMTTASLSHDFSKEINNRLTKFVFLDTPGQQNYRTTALQFIKGCSVAFLMFKPSDEGSVNAIPEWIRAIKEKCNLDIILVASFIDDEKEEALSKKVLDKYKNHIDIKEVFGISSKTGIGLDELLYKVYDNIYVVPKQPQDQKKKCC